MTPHLPIHQYFNLILSLYHYISNFIMSMYRQIKGVTNTLA